MRTETKKAYEKRIAALEALLARVEERATRHYNRSRMYENSYLRLLNARQVGERSREWAVEQAILAGQGDIVAAARRIAEFVYGPDFEAERPEENS
jgi:hypothetical protein